MRHPRHRIAGPTTENRLRRWRILRTTRSRECRKWIVYCDKQNPGRVSSAGQDAACGNRQLMPSLADTVQSYERGAAASIGMTHSNASS
jgi:hypothetical protein